MTSWHAVRVGIPIILGASENVERSGVMFHACCGRCERVVKMYEAVKRTNVSAFFAISLWDEEDAVVQCGECLGLFAGENADRVRASAEPAPSMLASLVSSVSRVSGVLPSRAPAASSAVPPKRTSKPPVIDDASIDAELAAMKKRLGK